MNEHFLEILVPAIGLVSGLIGAFVGLQNRALLAEVRREIAELENRILLRINGTFVRCSECQVRSEGIQRQFASLVEEVSAKAAAVLLRDDALQSRITRLVEEIGMRTIAGLLREEIVLQKIAALASDVRDRDANGS